MNSQARQAMATINGNILLCIWALTVWNSVFIFCCENRKWISFHASVIGNFYPVCLSACFGSSCLLSGKLIGESLVFKVIWYHLSRPLHLSVCLSVSLTHTHTQLPLKSNTGLLSHLRWKHFSSQVCCCIVHKIKTFEAFSSTLACVECPKISHDAKLVKCCCWLTLCSQIKC